MAIDATVGGADANSYVTLAEMTAYAATQSWNATWTAYTQDKKEISLISATKWLDTLTYKGSRNATTQKLSWPRTGATFDGVTSSATAIPAQIKTAQMELSWQLLQDPDALITRGTAPQAPTWLRPSWAIWFRSISRPKAPVLHRSTTLRIQRCSSNIPGFVTSSVAG